MKAWIPVLGVLLGATAWLTRGEEPRPSKAAVHRKSMAATPAEGPATPAAAAEAVPSSFLAKTESAPAPAKTVSSSGAAEELLGGELNLSGEQAERVRAIFEDRARAVADFEAEVHQRGWDRLDDFGFRVREMRELSYRRITAILDARQAARFETLRPALFAKDPISISIPEDKVVILDPAE